MRYAGLVKCLDGEPRVVGGRRTSKAQVSRTAHPHYLDDEEWKWRCVLLKDEPDLGHHHTEGREHSCEVLSRWV